MLLATADVSVPDFISFSESVSYKGNLSMTNYWCCSRELRIASLKSRRLAAVPASALEALRNKQNQLENDKKSFQAQLEDISRRAKQLEEWEAKLRIREEQIQKQRIYEVNNSARRSFDVAGTANSMLPLDRSL
ncbi:unnamed protein product [Gongylonema pulchrum]|uniref:SOAR domain-containing protein n=1 Tax=Gongylonema pulchrum TaxID=637853 RepID=A0A183CU83_9BILA|nr:unnamed protein product [Gongylonema pulchrum]